MAEDLPDEPQGKQHSIGKKVVSGFVSAAWYAQHLARNLTAGGLRAVSSANRSVIDPLPRIANFIESNDTSGLEANEPLYRANKLVEYCESYDLSRYVEHARSAADGLKNNCAPLLAQTVEADGKRYVDVLKFDTLGGVLEEQRKKLVDEVAIDARNEMIARINDKVGAAIPINELTAAGGEHGAYTKLAETLEDPNNDQFLQPQQVESAIKELFQEACTNLRQDKNNAVANVRTLFRDDPEFRRDLLTSLGVPDRATEAVKQQRLAQAETNMVTAVEKSYAEAEKKLKESFEGKAATKDEQGKDVPATTGLLKTVEKEKERCEDALWQKISRLEQLEQIGEVNLQGFVAEVEGAGAQGDNKRRLKGVSQERLDNYTFEGVLWGTRKLEKKTASGTVMNIEDGDDVFRVTMTIRAPWFDLNKSDMEVDFNEMVDQVKAHTLQNGRELSIRFNLSCDDVDRKHELIAAAYKAAREKGYKPDQITFNISGGSDEDEHEATRYNGKHKSSEVLQLAGLGNLEAKLAPRLQQLQEEKTEAARLTQIDTQQVTKDKIRQLRAQAPAAAPAAGPRDADEDHEALHNIFRV